ncbi:hypothetical protein N0V88_005090 [Collariella sp. IMI 366227]|nr:hypothetical protein N0V88_005090 [Collariella sp. IMI 366227]
MGIHHSSQTIINKANIPALALTTLSITGKMIHLTTVLLGVLSANAGVTAVPTPIDDADTPISTPSFLYGNGKDVNLTKRIVMYLQLNNAAAPDKHKFQAYMDFDHNSCYYTAAVNGMAVKNNGLDPGRGVLPGCLSSQCRNPDRLQNNNVYSRKRCNNEWYEYSFEKDQVNCGTYVGGHRHDWENIVVFTNDGIVRAAAITCHGKYTGSSNPRRNGYRVRVIYHVRTPTSSFPPTIFPPPRRRLAGNFGGGV